MPTITRLFILISVQFLTLACFAEPYQNHAAIFAAAKSYIQANLPPGADVDVSFTPLDPRLQLSACPQAIEVLNPAQNIKPGRNAIGVKCNSERPWSLYLAANIKIFENIVVLTQSVKRGDIITKEQLNLRKIDLSLVRSGYLPAIDLAAGQQATRNIAGGATLSPRDVTKAILVKRGANVVIALTHPAMSIQMQGIALTDGSAGQMIRVKNAVSGKIVSGSVLKQGIVTVNF